MPSKKEMLEHLDKLYHDLGYLLGYEVTEEDNVCKKNEEDK